MDYQQQIATYATELGIAADYASKRGLQPCLQAELLCPLGLDVIGRDQFAEPATAKAWRGMQAAAVSDGICLQLVSAFRSIDYQAALIRRKLEKGQSIEDVLQASAAPGYSEHHSGRALDLTTPGSAMLEECFEQSDAFDWLCRNAGTHGFTLSYPRNNRHGYVYEPWHWCFQEEGCRT